MLAPLAMAACDVQAMQFTNDERLTFTAPESREMVDVPFTLSWTMEDFDAVGLDGSDDDGSGAFLVFVDQAPMPAGKDLRWLTRNDPACQQDPQCPDATYLAQRDIYLTTEQSVEITSLPQVDGVGDEEHYVNVVVVNGEGTRIGESAWYLQFRKERTES